MSEPKLLDAAISPAREDCGHTPWTWVEESPVGAAISPADRCPLFLKCRKGGNEVGLAEVDGDERPAPVDGDEPSASAREGGGGGSWSGSPKMEAPPPSTIPTGQS
jgi:hypothetical protein